MNFFKLTYQSYNKEVVDFKTKGEITYWVVTNPDTKYTYYEDVDLVVRYYPKAYPKNDTGELIFWGNELNEIDNINTYVLTDHFDQREERLIWEEIDIYEIGISTGYDYSFIMSEKVKNIIIENCKSESYNIKPIKLFLKNQSLNYFYFRPNIPLDELKTFSNTIIYDKLKSNKSDFQIRSEKDLEKRSELFKTGNFVHIKRYSIQTDITSSYLYPGLYFSEKLVNLFNKYLVSGVEFIEQKEIKFIFEN